MTQPARPARAVPDGVLASLAIGAAAGAVAWLIVAAWAHVTRSYTRLDQLAALTLGGCVGAAILGGRALRRRRSAFPALLAGGLLGAVGALAGASFFAFAHGAVTPRVFLIERIAAWSAAGIVPTLLMAAWCGAHSRQRIGESAIIALAGTAVAGVLFTLPGASEAWQGIGFIWWGASLGVAVAGPELWRAAGVVDALPPRDGRTSLLGLREWPVYPGDTLSVAEAQVRCADGRLTFEPPAGGGHLDGRAVHHARVLTADTIATVGHRRYRIRILKSTP